MLDVPHCGGSKQLSCSSLVATHVSNTDSAEVGKFNNGLCGRAVVHHLADALRSIAISQRLLGTTEVIVIHHTDCGMLTFSDDVIRQKIRSDLGDSAGRAADQIQFLPFSDVDQSVRDDIQIVKDALIVAKGIPITGFVYDVETGKLKQVQ